MANGGNAALALDVVAERRILDLYERVADLPARGRDLILDAADERTAAAVRAMIARDARTALLATIASDGGGAIDVEEEAPEQIGPYRIVHELGRGGMGTVYLGERADGLFDHRVAIKLMRRALFSPAAHAQFAVERRILAKLHHPHIAQFLDGGVDADNRSYIVMELLDGAPITEHCEGLGIAERLNLFLQACDAVEHAHRNLVVHSDIKPSNVVVTADFGVKLLDFGIARLVGHADAPVLGAHTPGFSSPGQCAGEDATPADDVFALGRLLETLLEDCSTDADLAAIARKAADDDAGRRYGSVRELADDIARWRDHRPVVARPAEPLHSALLYWRRHRVGVAVVAGTILLLLATSAITTILYLRAAAARSAAEARFEETRRLSRYLVQDVTRDLAPLPGSARIRRAIAEHADRTLAEIDTDANASEALRIDRAEAYAQIGTILAQATLREGADPKAATDALEKATSELARLHAEQPERFDVALAYARAAGEQAEFLSSNQIDVSAARRLLARADAVLAGATKSHPRSRALAEARWDAALVHGDLRDNSGDFAGNAAAMKVVLATYPPLPLRHDAARGLRLERTWTLLANALYYQGDRKGALAAYHSAAAALAPARFAGDARVIARRAFAAFNIASALGETGEHAAALAAIEPEVAEVERLRAFDGSASARNIENIVRLEYAGHLAGTGRVDAAIAQGRRSIEGRRALAALQPDGYYAIRSVPVGMRPFAEMLREAGRTAEACTLFAQTDRAWSAIATKRALSDFDRDTERKIVRDALARCAR